MTHAEAMEWLRSRGFEIRHDHDATDGFHEVVAFTFDGAGEEIAGRAQYRKGASAEEEQAAELSAVLGLMGNELLPSDP
jgi:hypothetical protein